MRVLVFVLVPVANCGAVWALSGRGRMVSRVSVTRFETSVRSDCPPSELIAGKRNRLLTGERARAVRSTRSFLVDFVFVVSGRFRMVEGTRANGLLPQVTLRRGIWGAAAPQEP